VLNFEALVEGLRWPEGSRIHTSDFEWYKVDFEAGTGGQAQLCGLVEYFEFHGVRPVFVQEDAFPKDFIWPPSERGVGFQIVDPPEIEMSGPREEGIFWGWTQPDLAGSICLLPVESYAHTLWALNMDLPYFELAGVIQHFDCVVAGATSYCLDLVPRKTVTEKGLASIKEYFLQIGSSKWDVEAMTPFYWPGEFGR
jgi:hypothetical protein